MVETIMEEYTIRTAYLSENCLFRVIDIREMQRQLPLRKKWTQKCV